MRNGITVTASRTAAAASTAQGFQVANRITGAYSACRSRFNGLDDSGRISPRTSHPISTGTRVIESSAAPAIANVLVNASGLNSRPSCCSRANTVRKLAVMISREKNRAGPTCTALSRAISHRSTSRPSCSARSRCLCMFSTMTMAASVIAPIAIAMPPRLMMLELTPKARITRKENRMPSGRVTITTRADRAWNRNSAITAATISDSSSSFPSSVRTARRIRSLRSYAVRSRTPAGSPDSISASRSFTRSIVSQASAPKRMTTMPLTTSPLPSRSAAPRRGAGPMETLATSATRIGMPFSVTPTGPSRMSSTSPR